ncbi:hypothetical protein [Nocardia sp. NPDC057030]|uniref:hypothetical protein n=1 Tax=unclassified Nocardia TaxID=2637762 RepID=UPI0036379092
MPNPGSRPSSRPPRDGEVFERLKRNRDRLEQRRARARQREKAITAAVKRYVAAWVAIDECESKRDRDLETYRQQMQQLKTRADEEIAGYRAEQATAAVALREEGQSEDDVAELLEITPRQARQLMSAGRATPNESGPSDSRDKVESDERDLS